MQNNNIKLTPLPQNTEAEQTVLGAILIDAKCLDEDIGMLEVRDFYLEKHKLIYAEMKKMKAEDVPIDTFTIFNRLNGTQAWEKIGKSSYITHLSGLVPSTENVSYYAKLVKDKSNERKLAIKAIETAWELQSNKHDKKSINELLNGFKELEDEILDTPGNIPLVSASDLQKSHSEPLNYYVDGLMPVGAVLVVSAPPNTFKTWFALMMSEALSTGKQFLGRYTRKTNVIYLNKENPVNLLKERLELIGSEYDDNFKFWNYNTNPEPPRLVNNQSYKKLAAENTVIVIDSLIRFHDSDENSSSEMSQVMNAVRTLTKEGATVVILHHQGKGESQYRGSSEILAGCDIMYSLNYDRESKILTLKTEKNRYQPEFKISMKIETKNGFEFEIVEDPTYLEFKNNMNLIDEIIVNSEKAGGQPNQSKIVEKAIEQDSTLSRRKILNLLKKGEGKRWIKIKGNQKNEKIYASKSSVVQLSTPIVPNNWTTEIDGYLPPILTVEKTNE